MEREDLLIRTFVELADNLVAEFDVVDVLTTLATRSVELLGVDAAGILLVHDGGPLRVVATSSEDNAVLELFELQAEQGPAYECYRSGVAQSLGDVTQGPWPDLAAAAAGLGFHVAEARPMRLRNNVIGALNLLGRSTRGLGTADVAVAQALADAATISLLQNRALRDARLLSEQLQHALTSRVVIEQAKGVLCERWQTSMDQAFARLRGYARATNQNAQPGRSGRHDRAARARSSCRTRRPDAIPAARRRDQRDAGAPERRGHRGVSR